MFGINEMSISASINSTLTSNLIDTPMPKINALDKSNELLFTTQYAELKNSSVTEIDSINALSMMSKTPPPLPSLLQSLRDLDIQSENIATSADNLSTLSEGNMPIGKLLQHHSELMQWSASAQLLSSTTKSLQDGVQQLFKNS